MAFIAQNSFHYDNAGWTLSNVSRVLAGQNGLGCLRVGGGTYRNAVFGHVAKSEVIHGFCLRPTTLGAYRVFHLRLNGSFAMYMWLGTDGSIILQNGAGTEQGRTLPGFMASGVETYIELRYRGGSGTGQLELRLNGNPNPALNLTGLTLSATVNEAEFGSDSNPNLDFSAWYLLDVTGSAPYNTFLGHIRYACLDPTAEGTTTGWTPSAGTDNALMVDDETAQDGDATYNSANNAGDTDTYVTENMPTPSSSVLAVVPVIHARKSDAGIRALRHVIRRSGTDYPGALDHYLGNSYVAYRDPVLVDPSTGVAWTDAGIDAAEIGVKVSV